MKMREVENILSTPTFVLQSPVTEQFLRAIARDPDVHGKYLNTLSYIEHLGSRYLMLSHNKNTLNGEVLKHYLEEVRHSLVLRKMGEKISQRQMTYASTDMLVQPSASMYFARLATMVRKLCRTRPQNIILPYLYVSAAVEIRALWLYSMHERVLKELGIKISFAGVLGEEEEHIQYIYANLRQLDPDAESVLTDIVKEECSYFLHFFTQLLHSTQVLKKTDSFSTPVLATI